MAMEMASMSPQQQVMATAQASHEISEADYVPYQPLPDKRYDVTDGCESTVSCLAFPCNGYPTKSLLLQDQEVTLKKRSLCFTSKQKRPYAQIGSVDIVKVWGIFARVTSNLTPPLSEEQVQQQGPPGIAPGCMGCDVAMAEAIVADLQERKRLRGGIGQIRKLDYVLAKAAKMGTLAPMLVHSLGIEAVPKPMPVHDHKPLQRTEIDVSQCCEPLCGTTRTLVLGEEEAELQVKRNFGLCGTMNSKREYGEMGFVERQKQCVCCYSVASDLSPIVEHSKMVPGCPCANRAKVALIVQEFRDRMALRGQTGQIRKQEKILGMAAGIDESLRKVTGSMGLEYPPGQEEMQRRFGSQPPTLGEPVPPAEVLPMKSYDTTSLLDSYMGCIGTCCVAGLTQERVVLEQDDMYVYTKNNIDDSNIKIPYGEMDSVDVEQTGCCFWSVNGQSPGWGCRGEEVRQLAADLQERKEKRGNIAQLKQLRAMQATAVGLNVMADMAMEKEGVTIPTSAEERAAIWGTNLPRGLTDSLESPHIEVSAEFDTVTHDVTNIPTSCAILCGSCCSRGWHRTTLELDGEEMSLVETDWCTNMQSRTPYGNLGSVETEKIFCCCTLLPDIASPGFGCSGGLVQEIADQLQERKVKRGNIAQMKQQENIIVELLKLEVKLDVLAKFHGLTYPPSPDIRAKVFTPVEGYTPAELDFPVTELV